MEHQVDRGFAEAIAHVARALQAEPSAQATLQKMVDLAVATIEGCDDAGVTVIKESEFHTPAATGEVPRQVDQIQYSTGQGPCLDAIRQQRVFVTADLLAEQRWPLFAARTVAETGVRSMLSFRLFLEQDTLGSLNLYSKQRAAFSSDSQAVGEVFASHAALAMSAAQEHERVQAITEDLKLSRLQSRTHARKAELAVALQRGMLTELPDLGPLQVAARYLPATEAAEIGGDWYDAFWLPDGAVKVTVGDLAGHDLDAAVAMGQARNVLRSLSVDRPEPPGQLLDRFDTVLSQLLPGRTGTCVRPADPAQRPVAGTVRQRRAPAAPADHRRCGAVRGPAGRTAAGHRHRPAAINDPDAAAARFHAAALHRRAHRAAGPQPQRRPGRAQGHRRHAGRRTGRGVVCLLAIDLPL